jgi:GTPase
MRFADYAKLYLKAGDGGSGSVHFRREKYVPKGGPDGGDGGKGGDIVLKGNNQMNTLLDLRYHKYVKAPKGENGTGALKTGKDGETIVMEVPLGTVAYEADTRRRIGEVLLHGEELVIAKGGMGGKGNAFFKSPTNQTPREFQPGEAGEEVIVEIELKLIADVGLVGFPNAGKSTLLAALSSAKPKIADYPFTTLEPNLGVVSVGDHRSFVMADIPGIIQDAHKGKGLGIRFLRHIERNKMLLFVISCLKPDVKAEYDILLEELKAYRSDLIDKPKIVVVSMMDLHPGHELDEEISLDIPLIPISAVSGHNLNKLKEMIWKQLGHETS